MTKDQTFVIVGGGQAGAKAAEELRSQDFEGKIILFGAEDELPYERPVLSKGYLLDSEERASAFIHDQEWYADQQIELRLGTAVTTINPAEHQVVAADGETHGYDKLLLATGSQPRPLEVPGADSSGVLYLRNIDDADKIKSAISAGGPIVTIGGGWIGLEVTAAAREHGVAVTALIRDELPLAAVVGRTVAQVFADLHTEHGVNLLTGTEAASIESEDGQVRAVITTDGNRIEAAAVIVGIGATPRIEIAQAAGLATDRGVLVDASLRTSDPDIFAAGDIAEVDHPLLGRRIRVDHWSNANDSGPIAAQAMLGQQVSFEALPYFFTDQYDLGMEYIGAVPANAVDDVEIVGNPGGREFQALWKVAGQVVAGMHINMWDDGIELLKQQVLSGLER